MIKPSEFMHPEDAAALDAFKAIPGFTQAMKLVMKYVDEMQWYGENIASSIRLSPLQLPEIYRHLPPICARLGIEEPEFYLKMDPQPNAWTYGDTRVFITLTSGLVEALDDEELDAVIAHECGHIICRHTLYRTFEYIFWNTMSQNVPKDADGILKLAYLYWARKSELSCDRVAAMITSPDIALRMMARFAGGPKSITSKINMEEWAKQADIYDDLYKNNNLWNKALLLGNTMGLDHPFWAVRVREVLNWCKTEEYLKVKNNLNIIKDPSCERCGKPYQGKPTYCIHCGNKLKNT